MAYISNKDKKYQEKQQIKEAEVKANQPKFIPKDPAKSKVWKITNLILIAMMVLLPLVLVIVLIVQAANN